MREFIEQIFLLAAFDVPVTEGSHELLAWDGDELPITEWNFYDWRGEVAQRAGWL